MGDFIFLIFHLCGEQQDKRIICTSVNDDWKTSKPFSELVRNEVIEYERYLEIAVIDQLLTSNQITDNLLKN